MRHIGQRRQQPYVSVHSADHRDVNAAPDRQLLQRLQEPGSDALTVLYTRYSRPVFAFAASILDRRPDVEEVVQDTFVLAWQKLDPDRLAGESVLPWLLSTAKFLSYNANRKRIRLRLLEHDHNDEDSPTAGADQAVLDAEQSDVIQTALAGLTETDRSIVTLCLVRGLTYKEAARELGLTSHSIRNRLSRARHRLRTELLILRGEQS